MPTCFLDSSALAKRYLDEPGTARVIELFDSGAQIIVSRLAQVEIASAVVRRARAGGLSAELQELVLRALDEDLRSSLRVVELSGAVVSRAVDVVRRHGLRAADAIQLACALVSRDDPTSARFVCSDVELCHAAAREGFSVVDPSRSIDDAD